MRAGGARGSGRSAIVVLLVLGLLGAGLFAWAETFEDNKDRLLRLQNDIGAIDAAIDLFRRDFDGRLPSLDELAGRNARQKRYLPADQVTKDPWDNDYRIVLDERGAPIVGSDGPDGLAETEDDITSMNVRPRRR